MTDTEKQEREKDHIRIARLEERVKRGDVIITQLEKTLRHVTGVLQSNIELDENTPIGSRH